MLELFEFKDTYKLKVMSACYTMLGSDICMGNQMVTSEIRK